MPKINLTEKEAQELLLKIDKDSDNAHQLKKVLRPEPKEETAPPDTVAEDEAWVKSKWEEAKPIKGDALECFLCHKLASELGCGACYDCFKVWALECKHKKKKRRKHGDQHAGNNRSLQSVPT